MVEYNANVLINNKYGLGESPFYDDRNNTLSWVDIINGRLYIYDFNSIKSEMIEVIAKVNR